MRLLLVNHEFTITGASMVLFRLATHFVAAGHEVDIFPLNPAEGPMKTRYEAAGIPVRASVVPGEYDLALCNGICSADIVRQASGEVRTIWFIHETEVGLQVLLRSPELVEAFQLAAAVVYQTGFQRDIYRSFTYQLDPAKFHVIPNGVDIATPPQAALPPKTRDFRVVQVASVEPRKRPGDLIRAVARETLDAECVLCGKLFGVEDEALEIAKRDPGRYRFTGEIAPQQALAWMASADIVCLASASESQPVAVLEAAALGKPLLLSDLPCYRDIFSHGRNCLMFPPGHVEMLALSLAMYAASPALRAEMGEGAQLTAQRFGGTAFLARFDALLTTVKALPHQA